MIPYTPKVKTQPYLLESNMANRTFPSYWMYKDTQGKWRWTYHAANGEAIAVSSESYNRRVDCENSINIMKKSGSSEIWLPNELASAA